jgi:hypothetical protein
MLEQRKKMADLFAVIRKKNPNMVKQDEEKSH